MSRISFDRQQNMEVPTLLLQNRMFDTIGMIPNPSDLTYRERFNGADELSFTVYKDESKTHSLWDSITDFKIIYIPEFRERFEITVSTASQQTHSKHVTGTSLCEAELSQVKLYHLEINTETDILNPSYLEEFPTLFYRDPESFSAYTWNKEYTVEEKKQILRRSSLLHRILEKAEHYSIGHVDKSLADLQRTFSFSDTDLYQALTGEIAEECCCLFLFDSIHRTISAYDLSHVCKACGHRGDFSHCCPKCGSDKIKTPYGLDTTIFISNENLASEISLDTNRDSLKNCFYVEGGDETMTAAVRSLNPNGSNYFYHFSQDAKADMPKELTAAIESYDSFYESCYSKKEFPLPEETVTAYNQTVAEILRQFSKEDLSFRPLPDKLIGYASVTSAIYDVIDFYEFLENSMMPSIHTDGLGLEESLQNIVQGFADGFTDMKEDGTCSRSFSNQIALRNPTTAAQFTVENAIKKSAGLYYGRAYYDLEVKTLSYQQASASSHGSWRGTFVLTSLTEKKKDSDAFLSKESLPVALAIVQEAQLFIQQSIYRKTADMEKGRYSAVTSLQMDFDTFQEKAGLYSFRELHNLRDSFQDCLNIIDNAEIAEKSLQERYHKFYFDRFHYLDTEMLPKREMQLKAAAALYCIDASKHKASGILHEIHKETNSLLDFKQYVQNFSEEHGADLWKTFCSCRRETRYTNSNYISEGMTNKEILAHAEKLVETARNELYKASHLQYSLSASMNDLLALEAFQPLADTFSCGNWIHLSVDGNVYKLRLLSYQVNFSNLSSIDVEFSTLENIPSGVSDVKSILQSASSMSQSYSGVMHQMEQDSQAAEQVQDWLTEGLNAEQTKLVNSDAKEIVIDRHGILARQYDDVTDTYGNCQLKLSANGLYTTCDGWEHIQTGLGHISYFDPEKKELVKDYGIIAKSVVGKLFLGENLGIYNETGSLKFTEQGLEISNGTNTFLVNPNADDSAGFLQIYKNNQKQFYINSSGDVCLNGTIITSSNFSVSNTGTLSCVNADISGKIHALEGTIGGFSIGDHYLANGASLPGADPDSVYLGTDGISCGTGFSAYANGACSIQGEITAKGGITLMGGIWKQRPPLAPVFIPDAVSAEITTGQKTYHTSDLGFTGLVTGMYLKNNLIIDRIYTSDEDQTNAYFDNTGLYLQAKNKTGFAPVLQFDGSICTIGGKRPDGFIPSDNLPVKVNANLGDVTIDGTFQGTNLGTSSAPWTRLYADTLTLKPKTPHTASRINCLWADGNTHDGLTVGSDGLTTSIGWSGESKTELENGTIQTSLHPSLLKLRGQTVKVANAGGITTDSDERFKEKLKDLEDYDQVYLDLKPLSFQYKNGNSKRRHFGFGAGQVRDSLEKHGFTTQDFAGFVQMKQDADEIKDPMGLIYTEFIAWNTHMIQKLYAENEILKTRIKTLEEKMEV
ncbi:MAG: tail fiber domain-containing protein [Lachnospiraceae bacterium]|nr:tail fiber domain-containing protein [Lachnospiraceae bacterium]